jgi:hypothetical protein
MLRLPPLAWQARRAGVAASVQAQEQFVELATKTISH